MKSSKYLRRDTGASAYAGSKVSKSDKAKNDESLRHDVGTKSKKIQFRKSITFKVRNDYETGTFSPPTPQECSICMLEPSNEEILECIFCQTREVCIECAKTYLLGSNIPPHCQKCKKEWPLGFFNKTFPEDYRKGPYLESRRKILIDQQNAALPDTQPIAEAKMKRRELRHENKKIQKLMRDLQDTFDANRATLRTGVEIKKGQKYIFKCSAQDENGEMCKGFVEEATYECAMCKTKTCRKCHVTLGDPVKKKPVKEGPPEATPGAKAEERVAIEVYMRIQRTHRTKCEHA